MPLDVAAFRGSGIVLQNSKRRLPRRFLSLARARVQRARDGREGERTQPLSPAGQWGTSEDHVAHFPASESFLKWRALVMHRALGIVPEPGGNSERRLSR
jgi:hypothetical protein